MVMSSSSDSDTSMTEAILDQKSISHTDSSDDLHNGPSDDSSDDSFYDPANSRLGFTENNSLTYVTTCNHCLDFFFHVVPDTPSKSLRSRLEKAWKHDPLTTLKLVANLRGVRGTGKSDKDGFYTCALWLHENHPKTLACNIRVLAEFGYFKDLFEILFRLLEGANVRENLKKEWENKKRMEKYEASRIAMERRRINGSEKDKKEKKIKLPKEERRFAYESKINAERTKAREQRKERKSEKAKKAIERYEIDPAYRFLHDQVSDTFAETLKMDIEHLNSKELRKISLASKWCPSIDSSYDKTILICENIAKKMFPKESCHEYETMENAHYLCKAKNRLRKEILVPLRKVLELPEVYMCGNQWDSLPYNQVASVAMKNYKGHFRKHDEERFKAYLEDVKKGKSSIAAGALLPHEIIASLGHADGAGVAELQWARMVKDVSKLGKLRNCIAVCDVSGSMNGLPMEVCVSLGLLISELSDDPWKGKVITFSENPELHKIVGDSLLEKTSFIRRMDWGGNTDFQKVFDRILEVAVAGKLSEEQMIKRVFVFSDMEFDQASGNHRYSHSYYGYKDEELCKKGWETDYEVIQRKFRDKGFERVPEIVFWNLRNSKATPVLANQAGVGLVSGYSKNMVKMFLDNDGIVDPVDVMQAAITGELYEKLAIFD